MVVIVEVSRQHATEMLFIEDHDLVETLLADRPDPALRERMRIRRPEGRPDDRGSLGSEYGIECGGESGIAIVYQEALWHFPVLDPPAEVTSLLRHPCARRVGRAAAQMHLSTAHLDEKQHVDGLESGRLNSEEVAGNNVVVVMP